MKNVSRGCLLLLPLLVLFSFYGCTTTVDVEELEVAREEAAAFGSNIAVGSLSIIGLCDNGTVIGSNHIDPIIEEWENIAEISAGGENYVGLKEDGTVTRTPNEPKYYNFDTSSWDDIASILATGGTIIGLRDDGTVVATGDNELGQCDVADWANVKAIYGSGTNTVGLKNDGTVSVTGQNIENQKEVMSSWTDIVDIALRMDGVAGLKSDGTVVYCGYFMPENTEEAFDVSDWRDIVAISIGHSYLVGLKSDGTVVATGDNFRGQCEVNEWRNVVAIKATQRFTVGLDIEGNILITHKSVKDYKTYNASAEERAVALDADDNNIFYLTEDGRMKEIGGGKAFENLSDLRPLW